MKGKKTNLHCKSLTPNIKLFSREYFKRHLYVLPLNLQSLSGFSKKEREMKYQVERPKTNVPDLGI